MSEIPEPPPAASPLSALCVHGLTLAGAQALPEASSPRDLDVVDVFAGVAAIARAASARGFSAFAFDKDRIPGMTNVPGPASEDLASQAGFMSAVRLTCRLRHGGLLWLAPVCSSSVVLNTSRARRTRANPAGNEGYAPVRTGTALAEVTAFLWALATLRGATAVLENPTGSVIFHYGPVSTVLGTFEASYTRCDRCCFSDAPAGERWWKPFTFAGGPWSRHLQRLCTCPGRIHQPLCLKTGGKTSGTAALRASQAYPPALGDWVIDTWIAHSSSSRPCPASPRGTKRVACETDAAARITTPRVSGSGTAPSTPSKPTGSRRAPTAASLWKTPAEAAAGAARRPAHARRAPKEACPLSSGSPAAWKHPGGGGAPSGAWKAA